MKTEHNVRTWEGFLRKVAEIRRSTEPDQRELLFRGHGDARWSLQTTLERRGRGRMLLLDYYRTIGTRVRPQLESITGRSFEVPPYDELNKLLGTYDDFSRDLSFRRVPAYSYLVHVRHHGFPSPLLDWTQSPYVAAFFAFAPVQPPSVKKRTIYVWAESRDSEHGTNMLTLRRLGRFVTTHQRHVLQRSDYSVCVDFTSSKYEWRFASHEEAFADEGERAQRLWKINLPSSERLKVLKVLDDANVNAYSLLGTEESLMETLALREVEFR